MSSLCSSKICEFFPLGTKHKQRKLAISYQAHNSSLGRIKYEALLTWRPALADLDCGVFFDLLWPNLPPLPPFPPFPGYKNLKLNTDKKKIPL
jgi:hypothetical protein